MDTPELKASEERGKVSDEQKLRMSSLWDSLKRFDAYIGTVNFKSGLLTTLNAAIFGGVVLKADSFIQKESHYLYLLIFILTIITLLSLLSIYYVIKSIWPNLTSASTGPGETEPHSIFFFGSIAKNFTASEFANSVKIKSADELERDLSIQVHEVAVITDLKFKIISKAANLTKWNLVALLAFGLIQTLEVAGYYICHG
ncbi:MULTISPECIES: Pycsar system effector family protein [Pseudomonas]|uniref:Pycsar system effector family protein n=1 Tax=Pseudomonas TaxID=286 RepID=UPI000D5C627A|nr:MULTISPECIES: Pycsar system effector family protein [Pseudomonas]PWB37064.1 hypothetical protein DCO47_06135 [Pseudomonas sp. NDM]